MALTTGTKKGSARKRAKKIDAALPVNTTIEQPPKKKRGPRKKEVPPEKLKVKLRHRRSRANLRERTRMNRLNDALDRLRLICPVYGGAASALEQHHQEQQQQQLNESSSTTSSKLQEKISFSPVLTVPCSLPQMSLSLENSSQETIAFQLQRLSKIDTLRLARNYIKTLSLILEHGSMPEAVEYARMLCDGLSQQTTNMICGGLKVPPNLVIWPDHHAYYCSSSSSVPVCDFHQQPFPQSSEEGEAYRWQQQQPRYVVEASTKPPPPPPPSAEWRQMLTDEWQRAAAAAAAAAYYQDQQQQQCEQLLERNSSNSINVRQQNQRNTY